MSYLDSFLFKLHDRRRSLDGIENNAGVTDRYMKDILNKIEEILTF